MKLNNNIRLIRLVVYDGLLVVEFCLRSCSYRTRGSSYSRGGHQVQQRWICLSIPGKYNCSLFFLACGLNELEPDYVGHYCSLTTRRDSPRGVLPYKRLMRMCLWMGSHFLDWIDTHVTIKTWQKPETALDKSLAPRVTIMGSHFQ